MRHDGSSPRYFGSTRSAFLNTSDFLEGSLVLSFPKLHSLFCRFYHVTAQTDSYRKVVSDEKYKDPFELGRKDLKNFYDDIKKELRVSTDELKRMCEYYFDGKGKAFRPMIVVLMARACNFHHSNSGDVKTSQRSIAVIAEMIHTAALFHDDIIDDANSRRGKLTVNHIWGERKAVLAGDFILSVASLALARIGNTSIVSVLTQVIEDLVIGEFLQLGSKENENEKLAYYLEKSFKKTASLIANSCKAVSMLGCPDPKVHEIAYQYGKNVGIAFQLIDDVLDFTSCSDQLGKPASADLKLGIATSPVLFACQQFPEINAMIMRRFSLPGDVERTRECVLQSDGIQQTTFLAERYSHQAMREIGKLRPSPERDALIQLAEITPTWTLHPKPGTTTSLQPAADTSYRGSDERCGFLTSCTIQRHGKSHSDGSSEKPGRVSKQPHWYAAKQRPSRTVHQVQSDIGLPMTVHHAQSSPVVIHQSRHSSALVSHAPNSPAANSSLWSPTANHPANPSVPESITAATTNTTQQTQTPHLPQVSVNGSTMQSLYTEELHSASTRNRALSIEVQCSS
ncbi:all trans-polyprenyl-diphosphate synthase PDSS1-like [Tiliqua scincoides]|uniref:all trans-polyprenyl-diphosphate synthase PDSS1-like n=1 Tax=Tiliqua scincoides TaxID=71010 RepID=UPI0034626DA3